METKCPREAGNACPFCAAEAIEPCPLEESDPFTGPAIGASQAPGECSGGDVCESCQ
jgi:hypothetical protein